MNDTNMVRRSDPKYDDDLVNLRYLKKYIDDTGWITLNAEIKYRVKNGFITIAGWSSGTKTLSQNNYTNVGTLPSEYKPPITIPFTFQCIGGVVGNISAYVNDEGKILLYTDLANKNYWMFNVTYPV